MGMRSEMEKEEAKQEGKLRGAGSRWQEGKMELAQPLPFRHFMALGMGMCGWDHVTGRQFHSNGASIDILHMIGPLTRSTVKYAELSLVAMPSLSAWCFRHIQSCDLAFESNYPSQSQAASYSACVYYGVHANPEHPFLYATFQQTTWLPFCLMESTI